jgi:tellurite resistance protein
VTGKSGGADAHKALIYTMVLVSVADGAMSEREMRTLGEMVQFLPVFRDLDRSRIAQLTDECTGMMVDEDGVERVLDSIAAALPEPLIETAYAIACDVVAADGQATQAELRLLEMLRHRLDVDRLAAAAIERGARARHRRL